MSYYPAVLLVLWQVSSCSGSMCCEVCHNSKPCGDRCIALHQTCTAEHRSLGAGTNPHGWCECSQARISNVGLTAAALARGHRPLRSPAATDALGNAYQYCMTVECQLVNSLTSGASEGGFPVAMTASRPAHVTSRQDAHVSGLTDSIGPCLICLQAHGRRQSPRI